MPIPKKGDIVTIHRRFGAFVTPTGSVESYENGTLIFTIGWMGTYKMENVDPDIIEIRKSST